MACEFRNISGVRLSPTAIRVTGEVRGACEHLFVEIEAEASGVPPATGEANVAAGAELEWKAWEAIVADKHELTTVCKESKFYPRVYCKDAQDQIHCDTGYQDKHLQCCPTVTIASASADDECQLHDVGNFKRFRFKITVNWASAMQAPFDLKVSLWPGDATFDTKTGIINASPAQTVYTDADLLGGTVLYCRAGFEHNFKAEIIGETDCEGDHQKFPVPKCDCPPAQEGILTVYDSDDNVIPEPEGEYCVSGSVIYVVASDDVDGTVEWSASNGISYQVDSENPRRVEVTVPGDNTWTFAVTATAGVGDCKRAYPIALRRCDAPPPPPPDKPGNSNSNGNGNGNGNGEKKKNDNEDETEPSSSSFSLCPILEILALMGIGFLTFGLLTLVCPGFMAPIIMPPVSTLLSKIFIGFGIFLGLLGFLAWIIVCPPNKCGWLAFRWKVVMMIGLVMVYVGACPVCIWLVPGIVVTIVAFYFMYKWVTECKVDGCGVYIELIKFLVAFDVVMFLVVALGACVYTTNAPFVLVWSGFFVGLSYYVVQRLDDLKCAFR